MYNVNIKSVIDRNMNFIGFKEDFIIKVKIDIKDMFDTQRVMVLYNNNEWHRGIGKSNLISELSDLLEIPILIKTDSGIHKMNNENTIKLDKLLQGLSCSSKYVLIDEDNITLEDIEKIRYIGIIPIGFVSRNSLYYRLA